MAKIKTLTILFDTVLHRSEIPLFRGAIIASIPSRNILFHNHNGTALRYAYPLIQYKRIGGKAAIVCIGEGIEAMGEFLTTSSSKPLIIGKEERPFPIKRVNALQTEVQCWDASFEYRIRDWLPLNEANFKTFNETDSLIERMKMLERILTGNILSFAKGIGIQIASNIEVSITSVENIREVKYKRIPLRCMDIQFKSNYCCPVKLK